MTFKKKMIDKVVELVGEESVINGAYPVYFLPNWQNPRFVMNVTHSSRSRIRTSSVYNRKHGVTICFCDCVKFFLFFGNSFTFGSFSLKVLT